MTSSSTPRHNMVEGQLRPNHVRDAVVQARFAAVPREDFVAPETRPTAYAAAPAPQGEGREIFAPMVAARLVQALNLTPQDTVLVAAGGTGYTTAIIAGLANNVTLLEENATLRQTAATNLAEYPNVTITPGNPLTPPANTQPFTAILLDAPTTSIPQPLLNQLSPENGRLAAVRQNAAGLLEAVLITRSQNTHFEEVLFETHGTIPPFLTQPAPFHF